MAWVFQLEAMQMQKKKSAINTASASKIFLWMKYEPHCCGKKHALGLRPCKLRFSSLQVFMVKL